ncbi:hypothetical protein Actkin_03935 [Actinokineospora sp. UTMC 2448]|nr:hypothetical protein Actkin_03935 [Actinokineospora sp. UTMC 2448]
MASDVLGRGGSGRLRSTRCATSPACSPRRTTSSAAGLSADAVVTPTQHLRALLHGGFATEAVRQRLFSAVADIAGISFDAKAHAQPNVVSGSGSVVPLRPVGDRTTHSTSPRPPWSAPTGCPCGQRRHAHPPRPRPGLAGRTAKLTASPPPATRRTPSPAAAGTNRTGSPTTGPPRTRPWPRRAAPGGKRRRPHLRPSHLTATIDRFPQHQSLGKTLANLAHLTMARDDPNHAALSATVSSTAWARPLQLSVRCAAPTTHAGRRHPKIPAVRKLNACIGRCPQASLTQLLADTSGATSRRFGCRVRFPPGTSTTTTSSLRSTGFIIVQLVPSGFPFRGRGAHTSAC